MLSVLPSSLAEQERLDALQSYVSSGAFEETQFDHILQLAARIFDLPNVYISTVGDTTQICHAHLGLPFGEMDRDFAFCNFTIRSDEVLVVEDTRLDVRFSNNPLVTKGPRIRFYAGSPLISPGGHRLGALCLVDRVPRRFNLDERIVLRRLASFVVEHMELLRLNHQARLDTLTGLANRQTLLAKMQARAENSLATVLLIDLDGFKEINDTLGHGAGDDVLRRVSDRLKSFAGPDRTVARLGGDEFVIFIEGAADPLAAKALAGDVIDLAQATIDLDGQAVHIGASVGIAFAGATDRSADQLLGNADLALYQAKAAGRGCARIFTHDMRLRAQERGNTSLELQEAWESGAFELHYQPQIRLSDGKWVGAEALLRWQSPLHGTILPGSFLPVLELSQLALPVGEWIIRTACRQAASWQELSTGRFRMGVNLFAAQFRNRDLAIIIAKALADYRLAAYALELEITENIILQREQTIKEQLEDLRSMGVGVAFDDFGTGYASLAMLKDYPVSRLKIDRSFIRNLASNRQDQVIVEAITELARGLGLEVIAEGIEEIPQAEIMQGYFCQEGQGYLFGRPMPAKDFERRWLENCSGFAGRSLAG
ncbi:putative bifunctional diguanylate cyclase/phosphodiesterase [Consotaella aegiceratis]|uniref:putative bifunctional diguanylate cyclase/phosphodiesterase n=1 Tax=Consotaella aegiceratis TaxID=3097961 RepID=UPI002F4226F3